MLDLQDVNEKLHEAKKILIVDDFEENCEMLKDVLKCEYQCAYVKDSSAAIEFLKKYKPDLVILDYQMPGLLGTDICQMIRSTEGTKYLPVLFISGVATTDEKIKTFEMGADDFISKPFHIKELQVRLKRLLHNKGVGTAADLEVGNLKMDLFSRKAFIQHREIQLTPKQFDILKILISRKNNLVSRETFLKEIWTGIEVTSRNVDSQINYLKKKMESFSGRIVAVPGSGYRLEVHNIQAEAG
jgi:two-component system alkaline phosphatase synthesis response regulator PhoP